jgi:hypothetical protein
VKRAAILNHAFRHNDKPALGFEIFRLSQLFERSARREFDHALAVEIPSGDRGKTKYPELQLPYILQVGADAALPKK